MQILPIRTKILYPPQEDLYAFLDTECPQLKEKDILVISSKLVAIHQGHCVPHTHSMQLLIEQEADEILDQSNHMLTIKNNTIVPFAGIDESNGNSYYVLWPKNPYDAAEEIQAYLRKKYALENLGIIISESTLMPMRRGTVGISIGHFGFQVVRDYTNQQDIFNRQLMLSSANIVDSLASAAVLLMGEGNEQQPLALISDMKDINFSNTATKEELYISLEEDMFATMLRKMHKTSV